jgi:hypothetical protein
MTDADSRTTWLAVLGKSCGYVLDVYPEERRRAVGGRVLGEFQTDKEAWDRVTKAVVRQARVRRVQQQKSRTTP